MLFSLIRNLEKIDIILASGSPRRYDLLKSLGLNFKVVLSNIAEENSAASDPVHSVENNARAKGFAGAEKYPDHLVICADTVVACDEQPIGKPVNEEDAFRILSTLSGRTHQVHTCFGLIFTRYNASLFDTVTTDVTFRALTDEEKLAYINTGEPFDKAGAYGIQGQGALLVEKINGSYSNVVGFPLARFFVRLDSFLKPFGSI